MKNGDLEKSNKILISGAAGFIGSHLIELYSREGNTIVWGIVRKDLPKDQAHNVFWLALDLSYPLTIKMLPENVDIIIHCASPMGEGADTKEMFQVNVRATMDLLDYAKRAKVKRFIYISSGGVTGKHPDRITEMKLIRPETPYLMAKSAGEFVVRGCQSEIPWVIVRLFFPYGPGQIKGLIPRLCKQIWDHQPVFIDKEGGPKLNPIHIKDAVRLMNTIASGKLENVIINVAGSEIITIKDLASRIGQLLSVRPLFKVIDDECGDIVGSTNFFHKWYKVSTQMSLKPGLKEFTQWWRDHKK